METREIGITPGAILFLIGIMIPGLGAISWRVFLLGGLFMVLGVLIEFPEAREEVLRWFILGFFFLVEYNDWILPVLLGITVIAGPIGLVFAKLYDKRNSISHHSPERR